MSMERDALKKAIGIINFTHPNTWHEFISEVEELLTQPEQDNIQYLLDQVSRLTAENAMLKEKWLTKKDEEDEDMLEESGYNRSDWWGKE